MNSLTANLWSLCCCYLWGCAWTGFPCLFREAPEKWERSQVFRVRGGGRFPRGAPNSFRQSCVAGAGGNTPLATVLVVKRGPSRTGVKSIWFAVVQTSSSSGKSTSNIIARLLCLNHWVFIEYCNIITVLLASRKWVKWSKWLGPELEREGVSPPRPPWKHTRSNLMSVFCSKNQYCVWLTTVICGKLCKVWC